MTYRELAIVLATFVTIGVMVSLPACSGRRGPAERAGATVERAAEHAGDTAERTGRQVDRAVDDLTR